MGRFTKFQPLKPELDLTLLTTLGRKCQQAEEKNDPKAHGARSAWVNRFDRAIDECRIAKNLEGLKSLRKLTSPNAKLTKKLDTVITMTENTQKKQQRKAETGTPLNLGISAQGAMA